MHVDTVSRNRAGAHAAPPGTEAKSQPPNEPVCSVSESLAHGLVTRLATELDEVQRLRARRIAPPSPTMKRAAAYRNTIAYLTRLIPAKHIVAQVSEGDQSGKDKDAHHMLLHWGVAARSSESARDHALELQVALIWARHPNPDYRVMCRMQRHALMRLFFRLRTTSETEVMRELHEFGRACAHWSRAVGRLPSDSEILLPTGRGAFVLRRDREIEGGYVVVTWMSDERMVDNPRRQRAVQQARKEGGIVVNHVEAFPILSAERLERLARDLAARGATAETVAQVYNRLCDQQFGECSRLPAEWRFVEPGQLRPPAAPEQPQLKAAAQRERMRA